MTSRRLKYVADVRLSNVDKKCVADDPQVLLCNYTDVYYNDRITSALAFMSATATSEQCKAFGLRPEDVLITKDSETPDDIGVSAIVIGNIPDLVCGYHLALIRPMPDRIIGRYLRWALCSVPVRQHMSAAATGITRFGLRAEELVALPIPVPDLATQRVIADYLDRETARIDALVEAKLRLTVLLQESVRTRVANALSRDDFPTARLSRLASVYSGTGFPHDHQGQAEGDFPFYKVADLSASTDGRTLSKAANWIGYTTVEALGCRLAPPGAILFPKVGAALLANQRRITEITAAFDNNLMAIVAPAHDSRFLRYYLSLIDFAEFANPGPVPSINEEVVRAIKVPIPAITIQVEVANALDRAVDKITGAISTLARQIALTQEHRQALITAAVSGQLEISEQGAAVPA